MHRLILVGALAAYASGCLDPARYRTDWCERYCTPPATDDACAVECGARDDSDTDAGQADAAVADAGREDAGTDDAGPLDAGVADGGAEDAGLSDAGVADGGSRLTLKGVHELSAGACEPVLLGLEGFDLNGVFAIAVAISDLSANPVTLWSSSDCQTLPIASGDKILVRIDSPTRLYAYSPNPGVFSKSVSTKGASFTSALEFRARLNVTSDSPAAACSHWRARLTSRNGLFGAARPLTALQLSASMVVWATDSCSGKPAPLSLPEDGGFASFYTSAGSELILASGSTFVDSALVSATAADGGTYGICAVANECVERSCSTVCSCRETSAACMSAGQCCSGRCSSNLCD